jgi:hypothetical protein
MARNIEIESGTFSAALSEEEIISHKLDGLMESAPFKGSQQCRSFLSYVVTHTLHGDEGATFFLGKK